MCSGVDVDQYHSIPATPHPFAAKLCPLDGRCQFHGNAVVYRSIISMPFYFFPLWKHELHARCPGHVHLAYISVVLCPLHITISHLICVMHLGLHVVTLVLDCFHLIVLHFVVALVLITLTHIHLP